MQFELENVEEGLFNRLGAATVIVPEGRLPALAAVAIIARIEPIDTPEAPTNQERGQPLSKVDKVQEDPFGLDGSGVTVGVWEAGAEVIEARGAEDGVADGVQHSVAGRVSVRSAWVRELHTTQDAGAPLHQAMYVETEACANRHEVS